jgi:hypothetical protein
MTFEDEVDAGNVPVGMTRGQWQSLSITNPNAPRIIADNQVPGEPWWQTGQKVLLAILQSDQQRQIMQLNLERARQGLPPVDPTQYSGLGVQVGLAPQTQNLILIGLIGLGAILLLSRR